MAEELLQVIEMCGQSISLKYLLAYYQSAAQQLMFESEQARTVALQFFHAINLMFYFPDLVKEVVFVDPMAFLEWLTNVFEKSIQTVDATEDQVLIDGKIRLRDQALLTTSTLQSLQPKQTHPGICFVCDPWKRSVTSEGGHISWLEIGIEINIPAGAVSEEMTLELRVHQCLSGPFVLPAGYQLASPVYLISPVWV